LIWYATFPQKEAADLKRNKTEKFIRKNKGKGEKDNGK